MIRGYEHGRKFKTLPLRGKVEFSGKYDEYTEQGDSQTSFLFIIKNWV
jgi:hypothetical protein